MEPTQYINAKANVEIHLKGDLYDSMTATMESQKADEIIEKAQKIAAAHIYQGIANAIRNTL